MASKKNEETEVTGFDIDDPIQNDVANDDGTIDSEDNGEDPESEEGDKKGKLAHLDVKSIDVTKKFVFNINDKEVNLELIKQSVKECEEIVINGLEDKEGYKIAKTKLAQMRTTRTTLGKVKSQELKPVRDWLKETSDDVKLFQDEIAKGEAILKAKLDEVDRAAEIEREKKAKAKQLLIQSRITKLFDLGAKFDEISGLYSFTYDTSLVFNSLQVSEFSDEEWDEEVKTAQASYDAEQIRIEKEAADKLEKEKLVDQKDKQLTEKEQKLQDKQIKLRSKELHQYGADIVGQAFVVAGISVDMHDIINLEDEEWEEMIERIENALENGPEETAEVSQDDFNPENPFETEEESEANIGGFVQSEPDPEPESTVKPLWGSTPVTGFNAFPEDYSETDNDHTEEPTQYDNGTEDPMTREEMKQISLEEDMSGRLIEFWFTPESPYKEQRISKSMLRIYHPDFEELATNIAPDLIVDSGKMADSDMNFILYKLPR